MNPVWIHDCSSSTNGGDFTQHWTLQALLLCGAEANEPDNHGMTPLVAACHSGQLEVVEALLQSKADPSLAEAQGQTPLIAAAEEGLLDVVHAL